MTTVRAGTPEDRERLFEIQQAALAEPWPELLETALDGPPPLFVVADPDPVGYALLVVGDLVYIPEFAVDPARQRNGYGSRLLQSLCEQYADHEQLRVTVRTIDDHARAFYREHGFEQVDRVVDQFESCDGLVLARELP